jgi:Spy/CpxP family protein refolding chaperone
MPAGFKLRALPFLLACALLIVPSLASAQRGGGGGGIRSGSTGTPGRLDALALDLSLSKEQKNDIKMILDEAHKSAAPVRDALTKTHAAIEEAIHAGKPDADIDAAVQAYADQAAAMVAIEIKALADVMKKLTEEQRANNAAVSKAFFSMRGAFLDPKKWNDIPNGKLY